jgi:hypothetical protein
MLFRMPPSPLRVAVVAAAAAVVPMGAGAAGLGAALSAPTLGQPLEVVVPCRTGAQEPALPGCASAAAATEPVYAMSLRSAEAQAVDEALAAVAQAASAARGAASAAAVSAARIDSLEREVQQLLSELQNERAAAALLRAQLADGEEPGRWTLPLVALAVGLAAVALWLAWRLTGLQRQRRNGWRPAASTADSAIGSVRPSGLPAPPMVSELAAPPSEPLPPARALPAWPPAAPSAEVESTLSGYVTPVGAASGPAPQLAARQAPPPSSAPGQPAAPSAEPAAATTEPLAGPRSGAAQAPRDVSVEELIDLEQQAEFFVVLGQDEAAVDLLVEHLRQTGGGSPLPFLKLLEIFGRRGNRDAYERMRARFNRRFNAYAPEWGADLSHGRVLEDYPEVLPRLQAAWPRPLDAMAELEALLFRRSRGELFDLPAYREVLFLYSLARDLLDHEAVPSGSVDLLLPMADAQDPAYVASTEPTGPQPDREPDSGPDSGPMTLPLDEERATAPIDLDLSHPERVPSIFDPLADAPARRH